MKRLNTRKDQRKEPAMGTLIKWKNQNSPTQRIFINQKHAYFKENILIDSTLQTKTDIGIKKRALKPYF